MNDAPRTPLQIRQHIKETYVKGKYTLQQYRVDLDMNDSPERIATAIEQERLRVYLNALYWTIGEQRPESQMDKYEPKQKNDGNQD